MFRLRRLATSAATSAVFARRMSDDRIADAVARRPTGGDAPARPPPPAAAANPPPSSGGDMAHVTKAHVWALWNEGNLFSLSIPELAAFLRSHGGSGAEVDPKAKKSALVRQVEELMTAEQQQQAAAATAASTTEDSNAGVLTQDAADYNASQTGDLFEEADVYGDWGAELGFEDRKELDFMELSAARMQEAYETLSPRAFQLLHSESAADVGLASFDATKLPGQKGRADKAFAPVFLPANDANKIRFRRAFKWCVTNLWNMNIGGELNIGAGKALYWRAVAKHNRNVLPIWTCQQHLYTSHPYTWFAVAHEANVGEMEKLAATLGMTKTQDAVTSYKLGIRKSREHFDCELNSQLQCTLLERPWDRFLVSHVLRSKMPDLRYVVRTRHPMKKRIAEPYFVADILRLTKDSVQSVLSPDLGEVVYCCERKIRKWAVTLPVGVDLKLVETSRVPLIVTRPGEEGQRLEYELIASIPLAAERVDVHALSDELWEYGNQLAAALEGGMEELQAFTMASSAAFDVGLAGGR